MCVCVCVCVCDGGMGMETNEPLCLDVLGLLAVCVCFFHHDDNDDDEEDDEDDDDDIIIIIIISSLNSILTDWNNMITTRGETKHKSWKER